MPACPRFRVLALGGLALAALVLALGAGRAAAFGVPLQTGIVSYPPESHEDAALSRMKGVGAQFLKISFSWSSVAPQTPPPGFDPANPDQRAYRWGPWDQTIAGAVAHGLTPVIDIVEAPQWAQSPPGSGASPDPNQLALFAQAVATRYDGSRPGLPRVSYFEVWNEPNVSLFLQPQLAGNRIASVDIYRTMVNDFAAAVHVVHPDNVVIAGALFPNGLRRPGVTAIAPLDFTRRLFCLSAGAKPRRVCNATVNADVWSMHPYTSGGPATLPANPDDVWISGLQSLNTLVRAAQRLGTLVSTHPAQLWVSEFSWNSSPPDTGSVPVALEQRWVAEALYRAWRAEVRVFTWFKLSDEPVGVSPYQSGLEFNCPGGVSCAAPKPAAASFRFPFVAYSSAKHRVLVWGRTPRGAPGQVRVEWRQGARWRAFATLRTDADGIFTSRTALPRAASSSSALLRATQVGGGAAPAFSLRAPQEISVAPFG
jgi:hypothetical protein